MSLVLRDSHHAVIEVAPWDRVGSGLVDAPESPVEVGPQARDLDLMSHVLYGSLVMTLACGLEVPADKLALVLFVRIQRDVVVKAGVGVGVVVDVDLVEEVRQVVRREVPPRVLVVEQFELARTETEDVSAVQIAVAQNGTVFEYRL